MGRHSNGKTKKLIWDNYKEIGHVMKTGRIRYTFGIATRDGVRYINIREFYYSRKDEDWHPSTVGITVPIKYPVQLEDKSFIFQEVFEPFVEQLIACIGLLKDFPLADKDNEVWYIPKDKPPKKEEEINVSYKIVSITKKDG